MAVIIKPRALPDRPDYAAACKHTVTLYNKSGNIFYKTVFDKSAYLESKKVFQEGKTGVTATNPALLVLPQNANGNTYIDPVGYDALADKSGSFTLRGGDKAMPGIGPDITNATDWAGLISSKVAGVVTIAAVDVKRNLTGEIVHIEGGGA